MKHTGAHDLRITAETMSSLRTKALEFGFVPLENALGDDLMVELRAEALEQRANARPAEGTDANPYRSYIADVGNCAREFLTNQSVGELLQSAFDEPLELSAHANCYTYYEAGSFLSRHRDRPVECVATLIVYLDAASPDPLSPKTGLSLRVFNDDESGGPNPRAVIATTVGTVVIGRGSSFWHERPELQRGERVVALTACFRGAATA